jgi:hypothetical protein
VKEGSFDNKTVVRTATISSRYQVLIVTLLPLEAVPGNAEFVVVYEKVSFDIWPPNVYEFLLSLQFGQNDLAEFSFSVVSSYLKPADKPALSGSLYVIYVLL